MVFTLSGEFCLHTFENWFLQRLAATFNNLRFLPVKSIFHFTMV
jgi:hypothetical protein